VVIWAKRLRRETRVTSARYIRHGLVGITGYRPDCSPLAASFAYDPVGRRVEKTINGETTMYLYDGLDIIMEMDGNSAP
jgi:hypothetical protein